MINRDELSRLTGMLRIEGYGPVASEALARAWLQLGSDRGWNSTDVGRLAIEAAALGVLPDTVRTVTELTGRIISLAPAVPATPKPSKRQPPGKRVAVRSAGDPDPLNLKVSYE